MSETNLFNREIVLGIIVLFVGMNILTSVMSREAQAVMPMKTSNIITVDDEGDGDYASIQEAIDNAYSGDTIEVYSGTYYENVTIDKQLFLKGNSSELGSGDDSGNPVIDGGVCTRVIEILADADNVNITGFTIQNSVSQPDIGIDVYSDYNTISGNKISNNNHSILLKGSNNIISGNTLTDNNEYGITLQGSNNNIISDNNIMNNRGGLILEQSSNNKIIRNNIINITNDITRIHRDAIFWASKFLHCKNTWNQNYWNRTRLLPKPIFGKITIGFIPIPWINFDWHPATEPYEI